MITPEKQRELDSKLMQAVVGKDLSVVQQLVAEGADINTEVVYHKGLTALRRSFAAGNWEIATWMVLAGADITPQCSLECTAYQVALDELETQDPLMQKLIEAFLEKGADPNMCSQYCNRGVHVAVMYGYYDIAEKMIAKGANINALSALDETGLMCMVTMAKDKKAAVCWMMDHGADVTQRNSRGMTVFDFTDDPVLVNLLKEDRKKMKIDAIVTAVVKPQALDVKAGAIKKRKPPQP